MWSMAGSQKKPSASVLPLEELVFAWDIECSGMEHPLLHAYLVQHPQRVKELLRVLPEAKQGLRTVWAIDHEGCKLEHIALQQGNDALAELLIWGALFPELHRPLSAWWLTGRVYREGKYCMADLDRGMIRTVYRPSGGTQHWRHQEFDKWPFWARMAILPIVMPLFPFAYFTMLLQEVKKVRNLKFIYLLFLLPAMMLFPIYFLFPKTGRFLQPMLRPVRESMKVSEMVEEALL